MFQPLTLSERNGIPSCFGCGYATLPDISVVVRELDVSFAERTTTIQSLPPLS